MDVDETRVLARFEVVGERDDKALSGWTTRDKQSSIHDQLTFYPDNWDLGTELVVVVRTVPIRPSVRVLDTTASAADWSGGQP